ncbi:protein muscleblind isoform X18 [Drosophila navojoa]|uniref:protein muscleblind isoform X18 n=1 Tax=Drosophila navojoa TaxID=7232 RepID=UPI0008476288|nr:protein muscleblind isoform X18 [Drosophila navojoa]
MANVVNMNSLLNGKDSRWLQLEVCREFQRNKCSRQDTECKFAHPPANVEVQNGKVTACYDSIKGRCNRDKPPCKYFHPPQHLKDQLLINGRNHLALKNALMQQMGMAPGQQVISGQVPAVAANPYLTGIPANTYSPYYATGHLVPTLLGPDPTAVASQLGPVVPQTVQVAQQKIPRSDRLEQFSGMVPFKRPAAEKSGIPVYQPGATTYQQLMQPYVPVSCEYPPQQQHQQQQQQQPICSAITTTTTTTAATTTTATATTTTATTITGTMNKVSTAILKALPTLSTMMSAR